MSKYAEIIERLGNSTGPDRLIDVLVAYATDYTVEDISLRERLDRHGVEHMLEKVENGYNSVWKLLPRYTSSIDASLALVERMLPGWSWLVRDDDAGAFCNISVPELRDDPMVEWIDGKTCFPAYANTAPLSILLSLFTALEAKDE